MEEILEGSREVSTRASALNKLSWKEWLGTDAAVRWVYLVFGFALEKQIDSDDCKNYCQRRSFRHIHPIKERTRAG